MFVRIKETPNSPRKSVQIVASIRKGDKVTQKIVRYVGIAQNDFELEKLKQLAEVIKVQMENEAKPQLFSPDELAKCQENTWKEDKLVELNNDIKNFDVNLKDLKEESRVIEGIHDIYGEMFEQLGLPGLFGLRKMKSEKIFREMVLARIAEPKSKLKTTEILQRSFGQRLDINAVYRMMDQVDDDIIKKLKVKINSETTKLFKDNLDVVFFDVTTLYFESFEEDEDEFRSNGYSKDLKFNQPQVVLALMVTKEGLPVGYEIFPGKTYEGHVLIPCLTKLRIEYGINRVIFVADSGMFNEDNINALEAAGFEYIVGARLKNQTKEITEKILNHSDYYPVNTVEKLKEIAHPKGRLIMSYSEKRAKKDHYDRQKAIEKLLKKLRQKKNLTAKDLLNNYGYKKYLKEEGSSNIVINETKIREDQGWDGLMGVISNSKEIKPQEIINQYKQLWMIEDCFRIQKTSLKIRPIFHFKQARIKAHIAICFTAFTLMTHLRYRVRLQQKELSLDNIREELLSVQGSIYYNKKNKLRYYMPSSISEDALKIYKVLNLTKLKTPKIIST